MRKRTDYRLQGRLILVILFAALAAGCAVAPLTVFEQPKNYDGPYGYIVGSMVKDRRGEDPSPNGGSGYINFSSDDDTWVFNYAIMVDAPPIASKWDFVEDDYRGFVFLIPVALFLGLLGLGAFLWSLKSGQFDDLDGAAHRILFDDEEDS